MEQEGAEAERLELWSYNLWLTQIIFKGLVRNAEQDRLVMLLSETDMAQLSCPCATRPWQLLVYLGNCLQNSLWNHSRGRSFFCVVSSEGEREVAPICIGSSDEIMVAGASSRVKRKAKKDKIKQWSVFLSALQEASNQYKIASCMASMSRIRGL